VNSGGSPFDPMTGRLYGEDALYPGEWPQLGAPSGDDLARWQLSGMEEEPARPLRNTTIGMVVTNVKLDLAQTTRMASIAQDGLARAIRPVHTLFDGDTIFGASLGDAQLPTVGTVSSIGAASAGAAGLSFLYELGARTISRAVARAVLAAESTHGICSYRDLFPSACVADGSPRSGGGRGV